MPESTSSHGSRDVYSNLSLNDQSMDNSSMRAIYEADMTEPYDHDTDNEQSEHMISRPLSRSSVTSGLSMTATKDGVEGRKVQRYGIPQYSLNLLNSMSQAHWKTRKNSNDDLDSPMGPPMTLRERIKLLSTDALSKTDVDDSRQDSASLEVGSNESVSSSRYHRQHRELQENLLNGLHQNRVPRVNSELDSNVSTVDDDASYLQDIKSIPSIMVAVDSDND